jgi:hypothetical protein
MQCERKDVGVIAETTSNHSPPPLCPSAQPDWEGSVVIGVIGGTAEQPHMAYLTTPQSVTDELLALAGPVAPTEMLRFAAPCMCSGCVHFADAQCRLVARMVKLLPVVVEKLPACAIRPRCRWWLQEGRTACMRCPQVVTDNYNPSALMRQAAEPKSGLDHGVGHPTSLQAGQKHRSTRG